MKKDLKYELQRGVGPVLRRHILNFKFTKMIYFNLNVLNVSHSRINNFIAGKNKALNATFIALINFTDGAWESLNYFYFVVGKQCDIVAK